MYKLDITPDSLSNIVKQADNALQIPDDMSFTLSFLPRLNEDEVQEFNLDAPFSPNVNSLQSFSLSHDFELGQNLALHHGNFAMGIDTQVGAEQELLIIHPSKPLTGIQNTIADIIRSERDEEHIFVYLSANLNGNATFSGTAPLYSWLNLGVDASAQGNASFSRIQKIHKDTSAGEVLKSFFSNFRLASNTEAITSPSDIAAFNINGNIKVSTKLNSGYRVMGTESFNLSDLNSAFNYDVALGGHLMANVELGGRFRLVTNGGIASNWKRIRLYRLRDQEVTAGFGIDLKVDTSLSDFPKTPESLIETLIGLDPSAITKWSKTVDHANDVGDILSALKKEHGDFMEGWFKDLAKQTIEEELSNENLQQYIAFIEKTEKSYEDFKNANFRLLPFIKQFEGNFDKASKLVEKILAKSTREEFSSLLEDNEITHIIDTLLGDKLYEFLTNNSVFAKTYSQIQRLNRLLKGETDKELKEWFNSLIAQSKIIKEIDSIVASDSVDALKKVVDKEWGKTFARVYDFAADQLNDNASANNILQTLKPKAQTLLKFRKKAAEYIDLTTNFKMEASLAQTWSWASEKEAFIDVEINSQTEKGQELIDAAISGDFSTVLFNTNPETVKIHSFRLRKILEEAATVDFQAFGVSYKKSNIVKQIANVTIEPGNNGLIYIADSQTSHDLEINRSKRSSREQLNANFLFKASAELALDPNPPQGEDGIRREALIKRISNTSIQYKLLESLNNVAPENIEDYLRFAAQIGLILDERNTTDVIIKAFKKQMSNNGSEPEMKTITVDYMISYEPMSLYNVLTMHEDFAHIIQENLRALFSAIYISRRDNDSDGVRETMSYYRKATKIKIIQRQGVYKVSLIGEDGRSSKTYHFTQAKDLGQFKKAEDSFIKAFSHLDNVFDEISQNRTVVLDDLNDAIIDLMKVAKGNTLLGRRDFPWRDNAFFLVIDSIIQYYLPQARIGRSVLKITATDQGDKKWVHYITG